MICVYFIPITCKHVLQLNKQFYFKNTILIITISILRLRPMPLEQLFSSSMYRIAFHFSRYSIFPVPMFITCPLSPVAAVLPSLLSLKLM